MTKPTHFARSAWEYLVAVFWHRWVGIVVGFLTLIQTVEWFTNWTLPMPLWAKIALLGAALVVAQFQAYKDQRAKLEDLEKQLSEVTHSGVAEVPPQISQEKQEKLANLMMQGREIAKQVPKTSKPSIPTDKWKEEVKNWLETTGRFISQECKPQAMAKFLDDSYVPAVHYGDVPQELQGTLLTLNHRLGNLSNIIERPAVYL